MCEGQGVQWGGEALWVGLDAVLWMWSRLEMTGCNGVVVWIDIGLGGSG